MAKFNMQHHKSASKPAEKYLRDENLGPESDDKQPITEKVLPHREGDKLVTTEHQMNEVRQAENDPKILEKSLNDNNGKYVDHRKEQTDLTIPPLAAVVEKMRQKRLSDYKKAEEKKSHWSLDFDQEQNGKLPKWPDAPDSKGINVHNPEQWNKKHPESEEIVKGVTKANVNDLAEAIKTGKTLEYDAAIVAILRQADQEKRELSSVEQKTISNLKIARTQSFLKK